MNKKVLALCSLVTLISACSNITTPSNDNIDVKLKFKAQANGQNIECGKTYEGIGTTKSKVSVTDFRVYISNVRLIDEKGKEVNLVLEQDKKWQDGDLSLLDFENKTGECSSGTSETHTEITGKIAKGNYKSVKFTLGVPFEKNHQDVTKANSPLNLTSMFWVWNSGYKFMRVDLKSTGLPQGYFIHLGSTGCMTEPQTMNMGTKADHQDTGANASSPPTMCKNPNRSEVTLNDFDIEKNNVILDLDTLLADSNIDQNQENTPSGCMSAPEDSDCKLLFNNLGIDFGDSKSQGQKFFKVGL